MASARSATIPSIRPRPTIPMVWPKSTVPTNRFLSHWPSRTENMAWGMRRARASMRPACARPRPWRLRQGCSLPESRTRSLLGHRYCPRRSPPGRSPSAEKHSLRGPPSLSYGSEPPLRHTLEQGFRSPQVQSARAHSRQYLPRRGGVKARSHACRHKRESSWSYPVFPHSVEAAPPLLGTPAVTDQHPYEVRSP